MTAPSADVLVPRSHAPDASQGSGWPGRFEHPFALGAAGLHDLLLPEDAADIAVLHADARPPTRDQAVGMASDLARLRPRVRVLSLAEAASAEGGLDGVVAFDAWLPGGAVTPAALAATARGLLAPGGHLLLSWRNPWSTQSLRAAARGHAHGLLGGLRWRVDAVRRRLRADGFEDISAHFLVPGIASPLKAISLDTKAARLFYERLRPSERSRSMPFRVATCLGAAVNLRPHLEPAFLVMARRGRRR